MRYYELPRFFRNIAIESAKKSSNGSFSGIEENIQDNDYDFYGTEMENQSFRVDLLANGTIIWTEILKWNENERG